MIKKLDKLVLRAFIGPFLATFLLAIFVLILQFFWLWIDDFVGKGIDTPTLLQVILLVAASWVPVALPLAILLSTIMTFGNLGESYELVAIKSSGISLQRFMRPVLVVSVIICCIAFLFNNNVLPYVNLKLNKLKYEIVYTKPSFDIKPGIFYDKIDGYVLKIGSKNDETGSISQIVIYEKSNYLQDNLILADSGVMKVTPDKRNLEFDLYNGNRYEESGSRSSANTQLTRLSFKEYKKIFDLSSFFMLKSSDSSFKDNYRMLSIRQLNVYIDSVLKGNKEMLARIAKETAAAYAFKRWKDSGYIKTVAIKTPPTSILKVIPDSALDNCISNTLSTITSLRGNFEANNLLYQHRSRSLREYQLAWQQKFSLSFACFVLFLIGAPLGSIIRKGGLGTPLVFAVIFFVVFHLLNTTGEKMTREGILSIYVGPWLPCICLLPVGVFLTYKAMRDSQLFNKEYYLRIFKAIKSILPQSRTAKSV